MKVRDGNRSFSLTQKWQKYGVVVGHHKQVDTVESCAGLQVAEGLAQVTVLGTVTYKHLRDRATAKSAPSHSKNNL